MGKGSTQRKAPLEVDRDSLLELARGGNLYPSPFACLRELAQNAVDATLLRVFEEHGAVAFPTHGGSLRDLRARMAAHPIVVSITRLTDRRATHRYRIVVEDRGAGIRRSDVPYLQRVASSRKNPRRARLIGAMPEWMRPSGTFGIGLQSAFLVTDEICIETRALDGVASTIVVRAKDGGTIELREGRRRDVGTSVTLIACVPEALATSVRSHRGAARPDPLDGTLDPLAEAARSVVRDIGAGSIVPIHIDGAAVPSSFTSERAWFDPEALIEVVLPTEDGPGVADHRTPTDLHGRHRTGIESWQHYRGALVAHRGGGLMYGLTLSTNLHALTARETLLVGRDGWSTAGHAELERRALRAIARRCPALLAGANDCSPSLRAWLSAFARREGLSAPGPWWREIVLGAPRGAPAITLGDAHDAGGLTLQSPPRAARSLGSARFELSIGPDGPRAEAGFIWPLLDAFLPGWTHETAHRFVRTVSAARVTCFEALVRVVVEDPHPEQRSQFLAIPPELAALRVPDGALDDTPDARFLDPRFAMLSPWTFRPGEVVDLEGAVDWVAWTASGGGSTRTPADVARALIALLHRMDAPLRESPFRKVAYDLESVIAELRRVYLANDPTEAR